MRIKVHQITASPGSDEATLEARIRLEDVPAWLALGSGYVTLRQLDGARKRKGKDLPTALADEPGPVKNREPSAETDPLRYLVRELGSVEAAARVGATVSQVRAWYRDGTRPPSTIAEKIQRAADELRTEAARRAAEKAL